MRNEWVSVGKRDNWASRMTARQADRHNVNIRAGMEYRGEGDGDGDENVQISSAHREFVVKCSASG